MVLYHNIQGIPNVFFFHLSYNFTISALAYSNDETMLGQVITD